MTFNIRSIQRFVIFILATTTLYSCKTEEVYFNALVPATVTIPTYIKKVGIINRSPISDSSRFVKKLDLVLSAKSETIDSESSKECIRGLKDGLQQSNIFQGIAVLDSVNIPNYSPGIFPAPLSWDQVTDICQRNNVDALFALELFHTNTKLNLINSPVAIVAAKAPVVAGGGGLSTTISIGWRIYDPQNKIILDEFPMSQGLTFSGGGINPVDEATALMNHKAAVMTASYQLGQGYATRILPYTVRVCREFYIKGNMNFVMARRMADAGDWKRAADLWKNETLNPKPKLQARADYDMAIICEMNGDIDGAITWAKKAYETGGKRLALDYINELENRAADNQLLNQQAH